MPRLVLQSYTACPCTVAELRCVSLQSCRVTLRVLAELHCLSLQSYTACPCRVAGYTACPCRVAVLHCVSLQSCRVTLLVFAEWQSYTVCLCRVAELHCVSLRSCRVTVLVLAEFNRREVPTVRRPQGLRTRLGLLVPYCHSNHLPFVLLRGEGRACHCHFDRRSEQ